MMLCLKLQAVYIDSETAWHDNHTTSENMNSMILDQWDFTIGRATHCDTAEIKLNFQHKI